MKPQPVNIRATTTFRKQGGQWKVAGMAIPAHDRAEVLRGTSPATMFSIDTAKASLVSVGLTLLTATVPLDVLQEMFAW